MIDVKKHEANLYEYLTELDEITPLKPLLEKKGFRIGTDGKLRRAYGAQWNSPWIHQHQKEPQQCELWHELFFVHTRMTPTYCQDCYKVVVFIPTVENLFDLYRVQTDLEHPCKCGIEYRPTDERKYGGYFYNWGLEDGQRCYERVRKAVSENISPDIRVILKCACSEFEVENGPPAEWEPTEQQLKIERAIKRRVVMNTHKFRQFDYIKAYIMLRWIHHAAHIGDLTYKKFTRGKSIVPQMKTYHEELGNGTMAK